MATILSITGCSDGRKTYTVKRSVPVIPINAISNTTNGVKEENPEKIRRVFYKYYDSKAEVLDNYASKFTHVLSNDSQKVVCRYDYLLYLSLNSEIKNYINALRKKYYTQDWRSNYLVASKISSPENATNAQTLENVIDKINNNIKLNTDCPEIQPGSNSSLTISVITSVIDNSDTLFEGFRIEQDNKIFCFPCKSSVNNEFYYGVVSTLKSDLSNPTNEKTQEKLIDVSYAQINTGSAGAEIEEKCKLSEADFFEIQKRTQEWAARETGIDSSNYSELGLKITDLMNNKYKSRDADVDAKYRLIEAVNSYFIENKDKLKCPLIYNPKDNNVFVKIVDIYARDDQRVNFLGLKFIANDLETIYCLPCQSDDKTPNLFYYGVFAPKKNVPNPDISKKPVDKNPLPSYFPSNQIQILAPNDGESPEFASSRCYKQADDSKFLLGGSKFEIQEICFQKKSADLSKKDDYVIAINFVDETALPILISSVPSDASTDYLSECTKSDKDLPEYTTWLADLEHSSGATREAMSLSFGKAFVKNFTLKLGNLRATTDLVILQGTKEMLKKKVEINSWSRPACSP